MTACEALLYTYVATTRYSKEERASLELGDTIYPYDNRVEILLPDIKGVLLVKTSLPPDFLGRLLTSYYLSAVEYVSSITKCLSCYGVSPSVLVEYILKEVPSDLCFSRIRIPRPGLLDDETLGELRAELSRRAEERCPGILSLEIFDFVVCLGPVVYLRRVPRVAPPATSSKGKP